MKPTGTEEAEARRILAPLREAPAPEWTPARAARVWQGIEGARRPRPRWPVWALAGAAAAAAAWIFVTTRERPVEAPAAPAPVAALPAAGDHLTASHVLPSGAHVDVAGEVQLAEASPAGTRLVLEAGAVTSEVPPLHAGEHYVVETPQALVSVHGTKFTVSLTPAGTKVTVEHGVVEVAPRDGSPSVFLHAGESSEVGPTAAATPDAARAAETRGDWAEAVRLWKRIAEAARDPLERQNALVAAGHLLSDHDPAAAADHWRALSAEAPAGVHAEEAGWRTVEALRRAGRTAEAAEAARAFRAAFPHSPYVSALQTP
jgi:hypothetical protein